MAYQMHTEGAVPGDKSVWASRCPLVSSAKAKTRWSFVLLTVHPCTVSQINPTTCTILFNIFIYFFSPHVSGIHVPIIRRKLLYPCNNGTCHSVWVAAGLLVGLKLVSIQPADQSPPTGLQVPLSHGYSSSLLTMGTWMTETCGEEK